MTETKKIEAFKFVLSTKKEVIIRNPEFDDVERAMQLAGAAAGDNQAYLGIVLGKELIKGLLLQIDGKDIDPLAREVFKGLLTLKEFTEVQSTVMKMTGLGDRLGNPTTPELVMVSA